MRPLFEAIDPENIVWKSAATTKTAALRFGATYSKRTGIIEVTSEVAARYVFRSFRPREIVAKGDIVWGLFEVAGDYLPGGVPSYSDRPFAFECAIRWRLCGSKIVEHQAFFDTATLSHQINTRFCG